MRRSGQAGEIASQIKSQFHRHLKYRRNLPRPPGLGHRAFVVAVGQIKKMEHASQAASKQERVRVLTQMPNAHPNVFALIPNGEGGGN